MEQCVASVERHGDIFTRKIMSVDIFPGGVPMERYEQFRQKGWTVLSKNVIPRGSMVLNQYRAVSMAVSEMVFYTEDDSVIRTLPKVTTIQKLFREPIAGGKRAGFICFNNYVWKRVTENPKHITDFIRDPRNYIVVDGDVFLVKNRVIQDEYYLNFPTSITTRALFLELQEYTFAHKVGLDTEKAMTSAWFELGKNNDYAVLISVAPNILDDIQSGNMIALSDFGNYANIRFWSNDVTLRHPETPGRRGGCSIVRNMMEMYANL